MAFHKINRTAFWTVAATCILEIAICNYAVNAADLSDRFTVSGFGNATYQFTDESTSFGSSNPSEGIDDDGSFDGSRIALNISADVYDNIQVYSQFISHHNDDFDIALDWAFINYSVHDNVSLRVGKIKFPVGYVNEYVDVSYLYPWITPPSFIYSESGANMTTGATGGPQATRESYTGASVTSQHGFANDWTFSTDIFGGQVSLDAMSVKKMKGITLGLEYKDLIKLQISRYSGTMRPDNARNMMGMIMNGKTHEATLVGLHADWNNIIAYAEMADVEMDINTPPMMMLHNMANEMASAKTNYITIGYRLGKTTPFISRQSLKKGKTSTTDDQVITSAGFAYDLKENLILKIEYSNIDTKVGDGLFSGTPTSDSVNMIGTSLGFVF